MKEPGTENEATEVRGSYKYTAPDGTQVSVTYIANENGFQPQGTHISVAGIAPLQQRTTATITTQPQPQSSSSIIVTSEQPQTSQAAAQEEANGNGNGNVKESVNGNGDEVADAAEASLFRPVYRARGGSNYNRGRYQ